MSAPSGAATALQRCPGGRSRLLAPEQLPCVCTHASTARESNQLTLGVERDDASLGRNTPRPLRHTAGWASGRCRRTGSARKLVIAHGHETSAAANSPAPVVTCDSGVGASRHSTAFSNRGGPSFPSFFAIGRRKIQIPLPIQSSDFGPSESINAFRIPGLARTAQTAGNTVDRLAQSPVIMPKPTVLRFKEL